MIGIYCIRNLHNGNCYVGQSVNIHRRFTTHKKGSSKPTRLVRFALAKYGTAGFAFEVLEVCSEDNLSARECHWVAALDCVAPNGYNLTTGGEGGSPSEETRKKLSEAQTGKKHSAETRKKMSKARQKQKQKQKQKPRSKETRQRISESKRGEKNPMWGRKGHKHSAETRKKISEGNKGRVSWNKGRKHSSETRQKISEKARQRHAKRREKENHLKFDF